MRKRLDLIYSIVRLDGLPATPWQKNERERRRRRNKAARVMRRRQRRLAS